MNVDLGLVDSLGNPVDLSLFEICKNLLGGIAIFSIKRWFKVSRQSRRLRIDETLNKKPSLDLRNKVVIELEYFDAVLKGDSETAQDVVVGDDE